MKLFLLFQNETAYFHPFIVKLNNSHISFFEETTVRNATQEIAIIAFWLSRLSIFQYISRRSERRSLWNLTSRVSTATWISFHKELCHTPKSKRAAPCFTFPLLRENITMLLILVSRHLNDTIYSRLQRQLNAFLRNIEIAWHACQEAAKFPLSSFRNQGVSLLQKICFRAVF